jgi:hypothetical protein
LGGRGYVVHVIEMINAYKVLVRKVKDTDHLEDLGIDGSVKNGRLWTSFA